VKDRGAWNGAVEAEVALARSFTDIDCGRALANVVLLTDGNRYRIEYLVENVHVDAEGGNALCITSLIRGDTPVLTFVKIISYETSTGPAAYSEDISRGVSSNTFLLESDKLAERVIAALQRTAG